ncbi:hypothetical protein [Rheinheimera aquimaris]|uniref:hypothetical protein n=1 Tax=Rheinheimera aquimaris TaxID=412437 RepID=UPI000E8BAF4A|nr:hypothetical protein [Rheinheimera sp.]|tara:strand:- start:327 stop:743 length:417 start_codon:yes stop_codon:yes gene_type:complete
MKVKQARITAEREKEICDLVVLLASRAANGKVTWAQLEKATGFTRQALSAREQIAETYQCINGTKKTMVSTEQKLDELEAKLAKKEAECRRLSETLAEYDRKYVRWLYNATIANLTVDQLNAPLPESMKTISRKGNKK